MHRDDEGLFETLIGDGCSLITFCGLCLGLAGVFATFQSATGHFLPHDVAYLQMQPEELCGINECRIVHFMIHDRISFGGSLIAIAAIYVWMAAFPLRDREQWAWWTLTTSGITGFGSFLTYLGYGYLDTWHGAATLVLLPCFLWGLWKLRPKPAFVPITKWRSLFAPSVPIEWRTMTGKGRLLLLCVAAGMIGSGLTIQLIGMTSVFVPTDLTFMGMNREDLHAINPRLIPLIAHDRAGFGGAVMTAGLLTLACVWFGRPARSLWQTLCVGGFAGWSTAVMVHPAIGYNDTWHLAPAVTGVALFLVGLYLTKPRTTTCSSLH